MESKKCTRCLKILSLDEFRSKKDKSVKYYPNSTCKKCDAELAREYRKNNPDKVRNTKIAWNKKNKHKKSVYDRQYRDKIGNNVLYKRKIDKIQGDDKYKKKCAICGKEFFTLNSLAKFCSRECFYKNSKQERNGRKNPNYKKGNSVGIKEFKNISKEIDNCLIEKRGFVYCEYCGVSDPVWHFHKHHIIYRSEMPKHRNLHHKKNIINLCEKCHSYFHNKKNRRSFLVRDRKLWSIFPEISEKLKFEVRTKRNGWKQDQGCTRKSYRIM